MPRPDFDVYLITDRGQTRGRPLTEVVAEALKGGAQAVQVREKDLPGKELYKLLGALKKICKAQGARIFVNDRTDLALALDLDGVHLPGEGFPIDEARRLLGKGKLIGASAHSVDQAREAERLGADFVTIGPVYKTLSKEKYGPPLGLEKVSCAAQAVSIPVFALGGVQKERLEETAKTGVQGIAMISAIISAPDPEAAAQEIINKWREIKR